MIRAGVQGHGLDAMLHTPSSHTSSSTSDDDANSNESPSSEDDEDTKEEGTSHEYQQGGWGGAGKGESRRAMRVTSAAMDGKQCGVGLVLESWKPRGLAHALNLVARTCEAVRVDLVRLSLSPSHLSSPPPLLLSLFVWLCACVRAYPSLSLSLSLSLSRLLNLARARSLSLSLLLSSFPLSLSLSLSLSLICGCNEASHGHGKCSGAPSILQHLMLALKHTRAHHDTHILLKDSCGQWVGGGAGVVLYVGCRWCQTGQLTMQCHAWKRATLSR